jgi:hypothetical protein
MANKDHIRPLAGLPDHGFGPLGRLAHSVLAEYAGTAPPVPQLHLGQNTLPNPPFPMAAEVPFITDGGPPAGDDIVAGLLRDVLLAQYEWTSAVFGLVP